MCEFKIGFCFVFGVTFQMELTAAKTIRLELNFNENINTDHDPAFFILLLTKSLKFF